MDLIDELKLDGLLVYLALELIEDLHPLCVTSILECWL